MWITTKRSLTYTAGQVTSSTWKQRKRDYCCLDKNNRLEGKRSAAGERSSVSYVEKRNLWTKMKWQSIDCTLLGKMSRQLSTSQKAALKIWRWKVEGWRARLCQAVMVLKPSGDGVCHDSECSSFCSWFSAEIHQERSDCCLTQTDLPPDLSASQSDSSFHFWALLAMLEFLAFNLESSWYILALNSTTLVNENDFTWWF